jgi:Ca2+/H+ antiporter
VDLSLAVAFGSSTQISLFLLPMAAMLGWAIGVPFSFDFSPTFTTVRAQTADTAACLRVLTSARPSLQAFFASVIVVAVVVSDGEATWLKGIMLCGTYTIFCIGLLTNAGAAGVGGPASAPAAAQAAG